ncbi:MAG TPA: hypothetical protein VKY85_26410 [Candidatus Angelobacter sp.]|nr:hypothetical protein [Candidatus Angelobacter sp.]
MASRLAGCSSRLRQELCARNAAFARENHLSHVESYGSTPVIVYAPEEDGKRHGNFFAASYAAVLKRPEWARRLNKIHSRGRKSLPAADRKWRELDSSMSSDALLMNIFCCPGVCSSQSVASLLGTDTTDVPEFGCKARVPLLSSRTDQTEVDLTLGRLFVEAKLTEGDFQKKNPAVVESYRDLNKVFDVEALPRSGNQYISYQLIRNVLAAHASDASFCVIADARRPDLIEAWHAIMRCVRYAELRTRCKVLTWQELSAVLPGKLQQFLAAKYGIVPPHPLSSFAYA